MQKQANKKTILLLGVLVFTLAVSSFPLSVNAATNYSAWSYVQTITINHTQVAGSLTNFPVLVSIVDASLAVHAQSNGNDILFALPDGTQLAHEIESYDSGAGALVAWVAVPALSSTTDTDIHMFYGNPSASNQQNPAVVWDSDYKAVYHMCDATTSTITDSTGNGHTGTKTSAGNPAEVTGQIAQGQQNTANNKITTADSNDWYFTGDFTLECWVNFNAKHGQYWQNPFIAQDEGSGTTNKWMFCYDPAGQYTKLEYCNLAAGGVSRETHASTTWTPTLGTWYSLVVVKSGDTLTYYRNGVSEGTYIDSTPLPNVSATTNIFWSEQSPGYLNGELDEIRISNGVARSAEWVATEYANQNSSDTFLTASGETNNPAFVLPESPIGGLAAMLAVGAAFVVFMKRKSIHTCKKLS